MHMLEDFGAETEVRTSTYEITRYDLPTMKWNLISYIWRKKECVSVDCDEASLGKHIIKTDPTTRRAQFGNLTL